MEGLAELHTHLGGSVSSDILWSLAHEQGIALPVKDYWEFDRLVTIADPRGVADLNALDAIYHWTELIQSSPIAVERSVHAAIGGAYRSQGITTLELRFNPMKRNRGGERDLDHIILAAIRGLDRASLEYPQVNAGLILMMDRTFTAEMNAVIVDKAIRWAPRGICGIDVAGPRPRGERYLYRDLQPLVEEARDAGLGVTIHVGEEGGDAGIEEIGEVVETLRPDRIGHGILAARDPELMETLRATGIVLEICPTSNLLTKALPDEAAVRLTLRAFVEAGVPFLGLCLGAQLLTRAVGGQVGPHPEGLVEVGYVGIEPTPAGEPWFRGPMKVYEWHREGMTLPNCCEVLATNERYPVQAFRYGASAFGFQFHPEVTLEMKGIWTLSAAERLKSPGAQQRGVHLSMHALYDPPIDRWIDGFLDRWLATDVRRASDVLQAAE